MFRLNPARFSGSKQADSQFQNRKRDGAVSSEDDSPQPDVLSKLCKMCMRVLCLSRGVLSCEVVWCLCAFYLGIACTRVFL
jgi:hypothetical protein